MNRYQLAPLLLLAMFTLGCPEKTTTANKRTMAPVAAPVEIPHAPRWLNGDGQPDQALGNDGDYYLDNSTYNYYVRVEGQWGAPLGKLKGADGINGADGLDGEPAPAVTGAAGPVGPQGLRGDAGERGEIGPAGPQGVAGEPGVSWMGPQGLKGDNGAQGIQGVAGPAGAVGPIGPQGIQGVKGDTGEVGLVGPAGAQGIQGIKGDSGSAGLVGATGAQGIQGEVGPTGLQGVAGAAGAQGIQGVKGDNGDVGAAGAAGAQGIQGVKGDVGDTGEAGLQGIQGIQGVAGANGSVWYSGAADPVVGTGATGDYYLNTTSGAVFQKTVPGWGVAIASIMGPQGAAGAAGAAGAVGPAGASGSDGTDGISIGQFRYRIEWATGHSLTVKAVGGLVGATTMRIVLNDGSLRAHVGTLTWAFANGVGPLGLDVGAETWDSWYYLYAVPSGDTDFTLFASTAVPTVGPAGNSTFKYLGAFYNKSDMTIRTFYQSGNTFLYFQKQPVWIGTAGNMVGNHDISISGFVPKTASITYVMMKTDHFADWDGQHVTQQIGRAGFGTDALGLGYITQLGQSAWDSSVIPTPADAKAIGHILTAGNSGAIGTCMVTVTGWYDEYIQN